MENKQPQTISFNDKEYKVEDLTEKQVMIINHLKDLERKINSTTFQLDQLMVGRDAFSKLLSKELEEDLVN
jgi:hypothetical protein